MTFFAVICACALLTTERAEAEDYPSRPIKLLVGAPSGGTTDTVARALAEPMASALRDPKLREHLEQEGAAPVGSTSAEFAAFVRDDIKRWAPIVKQSGATPN